VDAAAVDVVLVRPSRAANVAAAARALKNMGLRSLVLVQPPEDLARAEARALAYGAWDVLDAARIAPDLRTAVARCALVAATSAREEAGAVFRSPREFARDAAALAGEGRIAVVFGPESTGLTRDEIALCQLRIRIPTDAPQPSVNLAQAVLIVAYEIRLASLGDAGPPPAVVRAEAGEVEAALDDLQAALLAAEFLNPARPQNVMAELRALLLRAAVTPREVTLLRGIARQVRWAASRVAPAGGGADNRRSSGGGAA
jgi:TrmH family RNA methyltransferase